MNPSTVCMVGLLVSLAGMVVLLALFVVLLFKRRLQLLGQPSCFADYRIGQEAAERDCFNCVWSNRCKRLSPE